MIVLEAGPFNGPDDPDASMTWVNITSYANDNLLPVGTSEGRQTDLEQVNPGTLTFLLNNQDHRFTPGNPLSPYFPGWRTGMRIRLRETLGYQTFTYFDGNMLQPDMTIQTPDADQTVTVSATDRLGRLSTSRTFISTLAEWIIYNGGSSLKAYYPLNETRGTAFRDVVGGRPQLKLRRNDSTLASQATSGPVVQLGQGASPAGDDLRGVLFTPSTVPYGNVNAMAQSYWLTTDFSTTEVSFAAGTPVTFVCWVNLDTAYTDVQSVAFANFVDSATRTTLTQFVLQRNSYINTDPTPGLWTASVFSIPSGLSGQATGGPLTRAGQTVPVAIQVSYSPNLVRLWLDDLEYTAVPTGTLTSPQILTGNFTIGWISGSVDHGQVYVGPYSRAQFLAQRDVGLTGLAGQYTGDRIRTLARYAGVADGDMDIDPGASRMQQASLAGKSPLAVMQEAATTEQGLLHARGRRLVFHDRTRRYNR